MTVGTTPPHPTTATAQPLHGTRVQAGRPGGPVELATAHLQMLGATASASGTALSLASPEFGEISSDITWGEAVFDEATAQAAVGLMHVHGRRDGAPRGVAIDYISAATGIVAVQGLLAASIGRLRGSEVRIADVSADRVGLLTISQYLAAACADDDEAAPVAPGGPPFSSADGVSFEVEALDPAVWARFWSALDAPERPVRQGWRAFQFRYATACAPIPPELHDTALARSWDQIRDAAEVSGAGLCRLRSLADRAEEIRAESTIPWDLVAHDGVSSTPPYTRATALRPLAGMTVLEAGRRVQAPLTAYLLGMLGADVIRIEPPGGDPLRGMPPTCADLSARWLALNRGKDAVEIDIKSRADRSRLLELTAQADVFLHNWAPGKAEQLGLGSTDLAAVNPALVYAYTSGWGGRVPDAPTGTDFMVQARTAVGEAARPADEPAVPSLMTLLDVLGGMLGAEVILAGLLSRELTGHGMAVESSLLSAAQILTAPALARIHRGEPARRHGRFRTPWPTGDGYVVTTDDTVTAAAAFADTLSSATTTDAVAFLGDHGIHGTAVTTDLSALPTDARFASALDTDSHGAVEVLSPWSFR